MIQHSTDSKYRPEIDGLRAFSIIAVVIYHAFPNLLPGGFVGVDIFFVISGYLITSIILSSRDDRRFTITGFYRRRIKRILPALILVLGFTLAAGWFLLLPLEYAALGKHTGAAAVFIPNFAFWGEAGYFDIDSLRKPLLHLWSLGVEEQFYIVWPVILIVAARMKLTPLLVSVAILLVSFALNIANVADHAGAFFLPHFRVWEILMGAVLAATQLRAKAPGLRSPQRGTLLALSGIVLMCLATLIINKERAFPGWWALLPTLGATLVLASSAHTWLNRVVLGTPVLVFIGKISYPLYLWHWPLLSLTRIIDVGEPSVKVRLAVVAISMMLAWLTYELVERRLRYHPAKVVPWVLLGALLGVGALGVAVWQYQGVPARTAQLNLMADQFVWHERGYFKRLKCPKEHPREPYCRYNGKNADIAVLGDSHAGNVFVALMHYYQDADTGVVRLEQPNCPPLYNVRIVEFGAADKCLEATNGNIDWVIQNSAIHTVYLSSMGPMYLIDDSPRYRMSSVADPALRSNKEVFAAGLRASVDRLIKAGKEVVIVVDWPGLSFEPRDCFDLRPFRLTKYQQPSCTMSREDYDTQSEGYRKILYSLAEEYPSLRYWNTVPAFCDEKSCHMMHNEKILYRDPGHLTIGGSRYLGEQLTLTPARETSTPSSH
ncbi:MAG: acyltransferase family protein [Halioglobus sp.]